ncbi:hypothetical protein B0T18DRAFT_42109 [Schizothecium vesticola]|uniref:Uncharacterized protein n=1 Tax=Schizothecium vesticola TaxID=314040 RepID=A0AA40FBD0_9PEZI|nr:hypothetical protein B0T18DRAFT_42109 [Schizothecium vesticola]
MNNRWRVDGPDVDRFLEKKRKGGLGQGQPPTFLFRVPIQDHSSVNGIPEAFAKTFGRQTRAFDGLGEQGHVIGGGVWVAQRPAVGSRSFFFFTSRPTSSLPPQLRMPLGSTSPPSKSHLPWKIPSPVPITRCRQPHRPLGTGAAAASPHIPRVGGRCPPEQEAVRRWVS